ncbi:hypothetical protein M501DRAFT_995709 [Patellaria atrata CBS 101060]|uniref:Required for respiratory growth protein 7, mitochondrial n=1 Tax=Patellaria atrata CBS 101060 TaxID=1346257 RepID=A0A9P4VPW8_9PEZI|nr:hypothetical protein M501DRAFT_995709 [Patellaria atrata CBS 101060]
MTLIRSLCSRRAPPYSHQIRCKSFTISSNYSPDPAIAHGSEEHNDLPSFLAYAKRIGLSDTKTVYRGTHYEYTVATSLKRLGFALSRTGRRADLGIDLLGQWSLQELPVPMRVLLQCKAQKKAVAPENIRELEGAFIGAPHRYRGDGVMGLLAAPKEATKGVRDALGRSRYPLGFLKISIDGTIEQFLWNQSAASAGLEGLGVTTRYVQENSTDAAEAEEMQKEVVLVWNGQILFSDRVLRHVTVQESSPENVSTEEESTSQQSRNKQKIVDQEQSELTVKRKRGRPRKSINL